MYAVHRLPPSPLLLVASGIHPPPGTSADPTDRPVVLVHGVFDSAACWFPVLDALVAAGRRVIAVDLPGHGASPRIERDFSLQHLAEAVHVTLRDAGVTSADVVGHSLGGLVSQQLAQTRPELVASLTLEDPAWGVASAPGLFPEILVQRVGQLATWSPQQILENGRAAHPEWDERDTAGWLEAKIDVDVGLTQASQDWIAATGPQAWDVYPGPVHLLTGECERGALVSPAMVEAASLTLGNRLVHRHVPGVGHDIRKDAKDTYVAALTEFLRDVHGSHV